VIASEARPTGFGKRVVSRQVTRRGPPLRRNCRFIAADGHRKRGSVLTAIEGRWALGSAKMSHPAKLK